MLEKELDDCMLNIDGLLYLIREKLLSYRINTMQFCHQVLADFLDELCIIMMLTLCQLLTRDGVC